jgi:hypothetical protein
MEKIRIDEDLGAMSPLRMTYSEQIFIKLADVLNEVHQLDHSVRFWKLVTEEYVRAVISRKQIMESRELRGHPDLYPVIDHSVPGRLKKLKRGTGKLLDHLKTPGYKDRLHHTIKNNNTLLAGFKSIPGFKEQMGGEELPDQELVVFGPGDRKARKRVNELACKSDDLFIKNMIRQIPTIFVEHFYSLYNSVQLFDPASKTFHVMGNFSPGRRQLTIARYIEAGSRLVWYQNGAFIGEIVNKYSRYLSHSVADDYRTWGWQMTEKDRPGKAWFLEKFRVAYEENSVNVSGKEYDLLLCFPKLSSRVKERLLRDGKKIIRQLDTDLYPGILVRPQPSSTLTGQSEILQSLFSDTRAVLSSGTSSMPAETASARCVVQLSVPATNFLECIYMDHPTMGILNNDQPTDLVQPWYRFLEQKGVLYSDGDSLAYGLNHMDIEEWWSDLVSTDGYREFKSKFARKTEL